MQIRKPVKRIFQLALIMVFSYLFYWTWQAAPIISGYGAKNVCSCVMLAGRDPQDVIRNELGGIPLRFGTFDVNYSDSSATGSVFGFARRKAIFRKGLGCSLLVGMEEKEFRKQKKRLAKAPHVDQDTLYWPDGDRLRPQLQTFDQQKLSAALDSAFLEPGKRKLRRTRAVVVVYDGNIIAERYADGFNKDSKLTGWSMTKSVTNALVGILVKEGIMAIDDPAHVPAWQNDTRKSITLHHLMQASSGLDWEENYAGPSAVTNMLFKEKDMGLYAASCPRIDDPGKVFYYSSGTTNIISRIIREKVGDDNYYRLPYDKLFYRIGMFNTTIETDAGGTFVGSSYCFGTARDWARFGLLYVQDGVWNGERILPEGWVNYSVTPAPGADKGQYGAQFWLNAGAKNNPSNRIYRGVPVDLFWADGFEGQNVFIIPSKKLVVVKLSLSQGNHVDDNEFLSSILEALPE